MEKLESIVIDIPNKIFEINHTPIKKCNKLRIEFNNGVWSVTKTDEYGPDGRLIAKE